jgi:hypothetical protein
VVIDYELAQRRGELRRERRNTAENRREPQTTTENRGEPRRRTRTAQFSAALRLCGEIADCEELAITTRAGHRPHPSETGAPRTMATGLRPRPIARRIRTTGGRIRTTGRRIRTTARRIRTTARRTETNRRGPPQRGPVREPTRHLTAPSAADFLLRGDALRLNRHAARRMRARHNSGHARYRGVRDRFRGDRRRSSTNRRR